MGASPPPEKVSFTVQCEEPKKNPCADAKNCSCNKADAAAGLLGKEDTVIEKRLKAEGKKT